LIDPNSTPPPAPSSSPDPTTTPAPAVPADPAAGPTGTAADLANLITQTPSPSADVKPGFTGVSMVDGYVKVINPASASGPASLGISIGGGTAVINGVLYNPAYQPRLNAKVKVLSQGNDFYVLGGETGSPGGGGGVPIGALLGLGYISTDPAWLYCNGAGFSATTYPELAKIYPGLVLPNLVDRILMGAGTNVGIGGTAGASTSSGVGPHTHTHVHDHGPHSHGPSGGGSFLTNRSGGAAAFASGSSFPGDNTSSVLAGSGGSNATSSAGSSFSILPPIYGAYWHLRAL